MQVTGFARITRCCFAVAAALLLLGLSSCTQQTVLLTARNDGGDLVAKLIWKEHTVMPGGDCVLVVTNPANAVLLNKTLIKNRDDFEDMKTEFTALSVTNRIVHLELRRNHYAGPVDIPVP